MCIYQRHKLYKEEITFINNLVIKFIIKLKEVEFKKNE